MAALTLRGALAAGVRPFGAGQHRRSEVANGTYVDLCCTQAPVSGTSRTPWGVGEHKPTTDDLTADQRTHRAHKGEATYVAHDPVAVLGLIRLIRLRSWDWLAGHEERDRVLRRFCAGAEAFARRAHGGTSCIHTPSGMSGRRRRRRHGRAEPVF